jgi:hypothetical protein
MFTSRFFAKRFFLCVGSSAALLFMIGCGMNTPDCGVSGIAVGPQTAMVDHTAAAPGNTQVFSATVQFKANNGCAIAAGTAALVNSNWTVSDPSVHLSQSPTGQVTATCTATVATPVNITATSADSNMFTSKAALTCN